MTGVMMPSVVSGYLDVGDGVSGVTEAQLVPAFSCAVVTTARRPVSTRSARGAGDDAACAGIAGPNAGPGDGQPLTAIDLDSERYLPPSESIRSCPRASVTSYQLTQQNAPDIMTERLPRQIPLVVRPPPVARSCNSVEVVRELQPYDRMNPRPSPTGLTIRTYSIQSPVKYCGTSRSTRGRSCRTSACPAGMGVAHRHQAGRAEIRRFRNLCRPPRGFKRTTGTCAGQSTGDSVCSVECHRIRVALVRNRTGRQFELPVWSRSRTPPVVSHTELLTADVSP